MQLTLLFAGGLMGLAALVPALSAQMIAPRQPLARVGGHAIYEEDVLMSAGAQLAQLRNAEYELKRKALLNLVYRELVEREAKGTGLSVEEFLVRKVDRSVPPPTASEIEAYQVAHKDPLGRSLEEIKPQLERVVGQLKVQRAREEYLNNLRRKAGVAITFARPRVEVSPDPSRTRGNPDARVTIIEFADFECPYSRQVEPTLTKVLTKYKDKVRIAFRDFPLKAIHPQAGQSAEATRCAGEQGKFWEYRDLLLGKEGVRLDATGLREHASKIGLDPERFEACLESRKFAALVERDILTGYKSGVSGTPTFYINGVMLVGTPQASAFEEIIDSELADAAPKGPPM